MGILDARSSARCAIVVFLAGGEDGVEGRDFGGRTLMCRRCRSRFGVVIRFRDNEFDFIRLNVDVEVRLCMGGIDAWGERPDYMV